MQKSAYFVFVFASLVTLAFACSQPTTTGSGRSSSGSSGDDDDDDDDTSSGSTSGKTPVSPVKGGTDPETGEIRYLALGDSLTQGVGVSDEATKSFPALLAAKWRAAGCKVELRNAGISGAPASQIISDQLPNVDEFKPTFVTFQGGGNDIFTDVSLETYRSGIAEIFQKLKDSGARTIVLYQNEWYRSPYVESSGGSGYAEKRVTFDEALSDQAKDHGFEMIDFRDIYKSQADNNEWGEDDIHPTEAAYAKWANELARVIPAPCK